MLAHHDAPGRGDGEGRNARIDSPISCTSNLRGVQWARSEKVANDAPPERVTTAAVLIGPSGDDFFSITRTR
jgi:hypothetical protein